MGNSEELPRRRASFPPTFKAHNAPPNTIPQAGTVPIDTQEKDTVFPQIGQKRRFVEYSEGGTEVKGTKQSMTFGKEVSPISEQSSVTFGVSKPAQEIHEDIKGHTEGVQMIDEYMKLDEKYADLEKELLLGSKEGSYVYSPKEMYKLSEIQIPGIINTQYQMRKSELQCCLSGIWPQINRVYITIDNKLYLWNYLNTADIASFEPVSSPIEAIALCLPISELTRILPPSVPYGLWIATDSEIRLFGLELSPSLNIFATDFVITPEGDKLNKMVGTLNGRLFYGGSEGHLNEINYAEVMSWFSKKPKMVKKDHNSNWIKSIIPSFFNLSGKFYMEDIVIDETRHTLYTLKQKKRGISEVISEIDVYDLGAYGTGFAEICRIQQGELLRKVLEFDERLKESFLQLKIAGIAAIDLTYAKDIQLLIVCQNGIRIYISFDVVIRDLAKEAHVSPDIAKYYAETYYEFKPRNSWSIAAVKFPPSTLRQVGTNEMKWEMEIGGMLNAPQGLQSVVKVLKSRDNRTLLLSDINATKGSSSLLLIGSNDGGLSNIRHLNLGRYNSQLKELLSCIEDNTNGMIIEISEEQFESKLDANIIRLLGLRTDANVEPCAVSYVGQTRTAFSLCCMPSTTKSVFIPALEYYILTTQSLSTFIKLRPVDHLFQALYTYETDKAPLDSFVTRYGKVETCTLLLHLLCNSSDGYYIETVENLEAEHRRSERPETVVYNTKPDKKMRDRARKIFFDIGNNIVFGNEEQKKPEIGSRTLDVFGAAIIRTPVANSNSTKLSALYLYVSRILRPIWEQFVTRCSNLESDIHLNQEGMWNEHQRRCIQYKLIEVRQFLEENTDQILDLQVGVRPTPLQRHLTAPGLVNEDRNFMKTFQEQLENMISKERKHIENLHKLVVRSIEGLELLSFMDDKDDFNHIQVRLSRESQLALASTIFKQIVYKQLSNDFLTSLIMHYLNTKKGRGVDVLKLANEIHEKCSNYFTRNHFNIYKAELLLEKAARIDNKVSQTNTIKEAVAILFENLMLVDLDRIIPLLLVLGQYSTAKKLCLAAAVGQETLADSDENMQSTQENERKNTCYNYVVQMLDELDNAIIRKVGDGSTATSLTIFMSVFDKLSPEELKELRDNLLDECFNESKDEILHLLLFRWMSNKKMVDKLTKIKSPYLDLFIKNRYEEDGSRQSEVVYKYLMANGQHQKAAEVLYNYAMSNRINSSGGILLSLDDRIHYLNIAINCIDELNNDKKKNAQEFVDFKYKLELCKDNIRIQISTLDALRDIAKRSNDPEQKNMAITSVSELEHSVIEIPVLYDSYIKKQELWELAIKVLVNMMKDDPEHKDYFEELYANYTHLIQDFYVKDNSAWPNNIAKKLRELAKLYYWNEAEKSTKKGAEDSGNAFFPVEIIVQKVEGLNTEFFDQKKEVMPLPGDYLAVYANMPEYWMIGLLRSDPLKYEYETIYDMYSKLDSNDNTDMKWELRISMLLLSCVTNWAISIREGKYSESTAEGCKFMAKQVKKKAESKLAVLGKTAPPHIEEYVRNFVAKIEECIIKPISIKPELGEITNLQLIPQKIDSERLEKQQERKAMTPKAKKTKGDLIKEFQLSVKLRTPKQ